MILALPPHDLPDVNALSVARADYARAGEALRRAELTMAARTVRKLWTRAARVLVDKDVNDREETDISLLVILDPDGELLWFNQNSRRVDCFDYPGAEVMSDDRGRPSVDLDEEVVKEIEEHLVAAYDAAGGASGALAPTSDDYFSSDRNLLALDIAAALTEPRDNNRLLHPQSKLGSAARRWGAQDADAGQPQPTDQQLWDWAGQVGAAAPDRVEQLREAYNAGRNATV